MPRVSWVVSGWCWQVEIAESFFLPGTWKARELWVPGIVRAEREVLEGRREVQADMLIGSAERTGAVKTDRTDSTRSIDGRIFLRVVMVSCEV